MVFIGAEQPRKQPGYIRGYYRLLTCLMLHQCGISCVSLYRLVALVAFSHEVDGYT